MSLCMCRPRIGYNSLRAARDLIALYPPVNDMEALTLAGETGFQDKKRSTFQGLEPRKLSSLLVTLPHSATVTFGMTYLPRQLPLLEFLVP